MSDWAPKRFWKNVTTEEREGGHAILLDGRSVRTPAKALLVVPSLALAQGIAAEWEAQEEKVDPRVMPLTRAANSALDKVTPQREAVAEMLAEYGDSDLLCYRAEHPAELVQRQTELWDPLLDWAEETLGARLEPRGGIMHRSQDQVALKALADRVAELSAFELAAFHDLVQLTGSLVLGFAAFLGVRPADEIWQLSRIDEDWQEAQWGTDEEAAETAAFKQAAFQDSVRFLELLRA